MQRIRATGTSLYVTVHVIICANLCKGKLTLLVQKSREAQIASCTLSELPLPPTALLQAPVSLGASSRHVVSNSPAAR